MNVCGETRLTENRSLFSTTITLRQMTPLEDAYHRLFNAYGPQHWWPAQSRFEVMIGAVLVQHSAWRNVERAIAALNAARLFVHWLQFLP